MVVTYLGLSPQVICKIVTKGNPSDFYWNIQINTEELRQQYYWSVFTKPYCWVEGRWRKVSPDEMRCKQLCDKFWLLARFRGNNTLQINVKCWLNEFQSLESLEKKGLVSAWLAQLWGNVSKHVDRNLWENLFVWPRRSSRYIHVLLFVHYYIKCTQSIFFLLLFIDEENK